MRVLIMSDSHGKSYYMEKAILKVSPIDCLIHLGDIEGEEDYLREIAQCPVYIVAGNNDFFSREPKEAVIQLENYKIFLAHGHRHNIYSGTERIVNAARQNNARIVMYGHTHIPKVDTSQDIWTVNPGSISLPRQEGRRPSYIVMDIDRMGDAHFSVNYFDN